MGPLFSIVAVKHLGGTHGKLKRNVFCHPGGLIQNLAPGLSEEGLAAAANLFLESGSEKHDSKEGARLVVALALARINNT